MHATAGGQHPLAVVLSCIDSRTPAELVFDLGLGDIFSIRIAGNILGPKVLASAEYGCAVAEAKLIMVMGHTQCGAVTAAVNLVGDARTPAEVTGCQHLDHIVRNIQQATDSDTYRNAEQLPAADKQPFVNSVARRNVLRVMTQMCQESQTLDGLAQNEQIIIVGAMYDITTGDIEFLTEPEPNMPQNPNPI